MLWWLAETTVVAAVLAGAAALLCRRFRPRPAVCHALWLVVLLKLLTPPLMAWPWPTPEPRADESPRAPPAELPVADPPDEAVTVWLPPESFVVEPASPPEPPAVELAPLAPVTPRSRAALAPLAVDVWAIGAALMAVVQLARIVRFRRQVSQGKPAPEALTAAVADVAVRLGVRPPPVVVVPFLASPVVWGLGRARLLWPTALLGRLPPEGERAAITHELAHLRRRDHWVGWLQLAASCVWWWSPLFWIVRRQLGRAAELACDAWVIETLPKARRAYAEALLAVCELASRRAAPEPALGMGGVRQEIERRLTMILRESVPSRAPVRALFGVVLLALIALPGFSGGQDSPAVGRSAEPASNKPAVATERPATRTVPDDREQRLQKLEASLEALLKEVKELHGAKTPPTATKPQPANNSSGTAVDYGYPVNRNSPYSNHQSSNGTAYTAPANKTVTLTRVTYTLPKDKADALATLLKNIKGAEVETQVKADGIVVTTTPEAQRVVGQFVGLLQGNLPATSNANSFQYSGLHRE
jgi:beta-lactamase regulating signal transducer with metallopeptidase domain